MEIQKRNCYLELDRNAIDHSNSDQLNHTEMYGAMLEFSLEYGAN